MSKQPLKKFSVIVFTSVKNITRKVTVRSKQWSVCSYDMQKYQKTKISKHLRVAQFSIDTIE